MPLVGKLMGNYNECIRLIAPEAKINLNYHKKREHYYMPFDVMQ